MSLLSMETHIQMLLKTPGAGFSRCSRAYYRSLLTIALAALALVGCPIVSKAHTLDAPATVVANADGSFAYDVIFTAEADVFIGGYELCGQALCGGENTTVLEFADGFCEFEMPKGQQNTIPVSGHLVDTSQSGRVLIQYSLCPGNLFGETEILPASSAVGDHAHSQETWQLTLTSANPVQETLSYRIELSEPASVVLGLVDVAGRLVAQRSPETVTAGTHEFTWDVVSTSGGSLGSGVYYLVAQRSGERRQAIRVVLVR